MMRRWMTPILVLSVVAAARPAIAGDPGPICREASVVDEITREVHNRNYYSTVNPELITETPTADPQFVHCQVCVQLAPYNTLRFGDHPVARCVEQGFEIHIMPGGFIVNGLD